MLGIRYVLVRRDRAVGTPVLARERSNESNHCNHNRGGRFDINKPSEQPAGRCRARCRANGMLASSDVILLWPL